MAISEEVPGLDVTIEVEGTALPEYDYDSAHDDGLASSSLKYVEAPSGADFTIRYLFRAPFTPPSFVQMDVVLDDNYIQAPLVECGRKDECEGYLYSKSILTIDGQDFTQNFRFSPLVTEESNTPITAELRQQLANIGRIVLYFYFVEDMEAVRPAQVPQLDMAKLEGLSEKAMYKVASTPGDTLTHQTSLTIPEQRGGLTYNRIKTISNEPFATFTFYYRSTSALKSLGIIPRTPSPTLEYETPEKPLEEMSPEELIEELTRRRHQEHEAIRVKREREESENTLVGDEGLVWLGTQPTPEIMEKANKKMRRGPSADDEVLVLDD